MKKKNILIFMSLMLLLTLCACGNRTEKQAETSAKPLRIVSSMLTSTYTVNLPLPQYCSSVLPIQ